MPLPKITAPTYELVLPSSGRKIRYRPFLVKEEKLLIIAMESEDTKQITEAVKNVATVFPKRFTGHLLHVMHQILRRNGIQPAAIHNLDPVSPGLGVMGVHHPAQPMQFSAQIRHVRAVGDTGLHHLGGVAGTRCHRRDYHPGAGSNMVRRGSVRPRHHKHRKQRITDFRF